MMTKINKTSLAAEEKNNLYKNGYRYIVEGDYETLDTTDPWSGMPNTTNNIYAFTDKAEAEAFAVTQTWVFNSNIHASVEELPEHTKTRAEICEEEDKKKREREAKKKAKEAKKAAEAGMTVEEYRAYKNRQAKIRRYKNEIKKAETNIKELEEEIAWKKEYIEKLKKEG